MFRSLMIGAVSVAALTLTTAAFSQQSKYGTPAEARAMLDKAIAAVKADKTKALASFNAGTDGFKDRDLQPFCWDVKSGEMVASTMPGNVAAHKIQCDLKDPTGKAFGKEQCAGAVEGKIIEVSYQYPRPGETAPTPKVSYITRIGDVGCGVGYYK
jgi:hypothetical protein